MSKSRIAGTLYSKPVWDRWYKTRRWKKLRLEHLAKQPFCQCPHHEGTRTKGNVVDHIEPHRGDTRRFWDRRNLQTLTMTCHNSYKQSQEKGGRGFDVGSDANGNPLIKLDHWK